ncbi:MAG TPA: winged helix DNA-binding domain-containing protein [Solirubrobacteraceae bacterium]|nr:winged helix DNA-binding domain-containing protein [Solirubrobacteraceae bacterium]
MASLRRTRAARQLLHRPAGLTATEVVRRLLAVQAQDLPAARRALRVRTRGLTVVDVNAALSDERSIVRGWLGRGTLHMVAAEDYPWMLALTAPTQATNSRRRLEEEGVSEADADRAMRIVEGALADEGPLTRRELRERVAAKGIRTEGQAMPHLLGRAVLRGIAMLGPMRGSQQAVVLARDWLGAAPRSSLEGAERDAALAELARRYLAGHGPATERDLAYWVGLPLRDARVGLVGIAGELAVLDDGLVDLAAAPEAARRTGARLLPVFDPYLLGWKERAFEVDAQHVPKVYAGGLIGPAAAVDGRLVGTWRAVRRGDRLALDVEPFEPLSPRADAALRREREDLARFEDVELAEAP